MQPPHSTTSELAQASTQPSSIPADAAAPAVDAAAPAVVRRSGAEVGSPRPDESPPSRNRVRPPTPARGVLSRPNPPPPRATPEGSGLLDSFFHRIFKLKWPCFWRDGGREHRPPPPRTLVPARGLSLACCAGCQALNCDRMRLIHMIVIAYACARSEKTVWCVLPLKSKVLFILLQ